MKTTRNYVFGLAFLLVALVSVIMLTTKSAHAQSVIFSQSMDIGSTGAQVTALQTFLATKTSHYPEGLVTGYYGPLTAAAVMRFQCAEEIVCSGSAATTGYGRVGPITLKQLNLVASGVVTGGADVSAPYIALTAVATSSNAATVSFSTTELASAKVYYASSPITLSEGIGIGFGPFISGTAVMTDTNLRSAHSVAIGGLASNTTYFYVIQVTDASGNVSVTWPASFRTGN